MNIKQSFKLLAMFLSILFVLFPLQKHLQKLWTIQSIKWIGVIVSLRRNQSEQSLLKRQMAKLLLLKCRFKISKWSRFTGNGESGY